MTMVYASILRSVVGRSFVYAPSFVFDTKVDSKSSIMDIPKNDFIWKFPRIRACTFQDLA